MNADDADNRRGEKFFARHRGMFLSRDPVAGRMIPDHRQVLQKPVPETVQAFVYIVGFHFPCTR